MAKDKRIILLFLMGGISLGSSTLRIFAGLAPFDMMFIPIFLFTLFARQFVVDRYFLFFIAFALLGLLIIPFNNVKHGSILLEFRYYAYIPMSYYIAKYFISDTSTFSGKLFSSCIFFNILALILLYAAVLQGSGPIYEMFNNDDSLTLLKKAGQNDRLVGPPITFITYMMLIYVSTSQEKLTQRNIILFVLLTLFVFVVVGSRQLLITALLPIVYYVLKRRNFTMMAFLALGLVVIPLFLSVGNQHRYETMLSPTEDSSFMFRMVSSAGMLMQLYNDNRLWLGYGIGSDFTFFHSEYFTHFFIDNTYVVITYKYGIPLMLLFLAVLLSISRRLPLLQRGTLILLLCVPAAVSYLLVLDPAYLLGYFTCSFVLRRWLEKRGQASTSLSGHTSYAG